MVLPPVLVWASFAIILYTRVSDCSCPPPLADRRTCHAAAGVWGGLLAALSHTHPRVTVLSRLRLVFSPRVMPPSSCRARAR